MRWQRAYTDETKGEAQKIVRDWRSSWRKKGKPVPHLKIRKDPNGRYEVWVHTT